MKQKLHSPHGDLSYQTAYSQNVIIASMSDFLNKGKFALITSVLGMCDILMTPVTFTVTTK
jgi:hypothetical protein